MRGGRSFLGAGALALALVVVATASAAWGGPDPAGNTPVGVLPYSCDKAPTAAECINAGVFYLDRARAKAGLPPYALPANFPSLSPGRQMFILVNLDRIAYHLPPMPGLTAELNHDALVSGVWRAGDPYPSNASRLNTWWPGHAGGYDNVPLAYEGWVWADGLGSPNPRCTRYDHSRCWGHRHSVLWKFPAGSVLAMGAAAGHDSSYRPGYAYLFVGGSSGYSASYSYTWKQAVASGAGRNAYDPGIAPAKMCRVPFIMGLTQAEAIRAVEKTHCAVGDIVRKQSGYAAGIVYQQHPPPYRAFAPGTKVKMTVSLGPA